MLETMDTVTIMSLLGGLKHPITCSVGMVCYCLGSYFYQKGYTDMTLDVKDARYKKGGMIKMIGLFAPFFCTISLAYTLITG